MHVAQVAAFAKWSDPGLCGRAWKDRETFFCGHACSSKRGFDSSFFASSRFSRLKRFPWRCGRLAKHTAAPARPCSSSHDTAAAEAEGRRRWAAWGGGVGKWSCIVTKPLSSASIIQWILKPQRRWIGCHLVELLHSNTWTHILFRRVITLLLYGDMAVLHHGKKKNPLEFIINAGIWRLISFSRFPGIVRNTFPRTWMITITSSIFRSKLNVCICSQ